MKKINEELNYMKYLFGYQKGVVISEQTTPTSDTPMQPQAQGTPASDPTQGGDGCQEFTSVGRFSEKSADGGQTELQTLINDIISKPEFKNGGTITSMKIIGGASNVEKGEQTSWDLDNNYNENPDTKINRGPKYNANIGYATKRANTAQEPVINGLAASGINLAAGVTPVIEAKVIYTYGTSDSSNATKIKSGEVKPGQVVIVKLVVCPAQQKKGGTEDDLGKIPTLPLTDMSIKTGEIITPMLECFTGVVIKVNFDENASDQNHNCEKAVWDITANGIPIFRKNRNGTTVSYASLNNIYDNYDDAEERAPKGGNSTDKGGYRYNTFTIDEITARKFSNLEKVQEYKGNLEISMKCQIGSAGTLNINGHKTSGGGCHKGTASIEVTSKEGDFNQGVNPPVKSGEQRVVYSVKACTGIFKKTLESGNLVPGKLVGTGTELSSKQTDQMIQASKYANLPQDVKSNIQKIGQAMQK
jgi:hypothetical protein